MWRIICHGGAWSIPDEIESASLDGIKVREWDRSLNKSDEIQDAAKSGASVLSEGGEAEDAVVAAVRTMGE